MPPYMKIVTFLLTITGCARSRKVVDLTHVYDENNPKYPLGFLGVDYVNYFTMTNLFQGYVSNASDTWVAMRKVEMFEHQGTHIDAPLHFANGGQDLTQIPPERLYGPGVVIDVRDKAAVNSDYAVSVEDIHAVEEKYGKIPPGAIVMMNSGWASKYPDAARVFGSQNIHDPSTFHFPGFSLDACKFLLTHRQVNVLGVDTPSIDPAAKPGFLCHRFLQPNGVPLLEYVANLDAIPPNGTTIVLGAPKIRNGTGGHTRIFAFLDDNDDMTGSASSRLSVAVLIITIINLLFSHASISSL